MRDSMGPITSHRGRASAVTALAEFLPGFDVGSWNGLFVAPGTPAVAIERLNAALNVAVRDAELRERYGKLGFELVGGTPGELAAHLHDEIGKWSALRKTAELPTD